MKYFNSKKAGAVYVAGILLLLAGLYWNNNYSFSQDLENHYTLANKIAYDGNVNAGYHGNLGGMKYYPPVSHYLAAGAGRLFDSTLIGMNFVSMAAFAFIYFAIAYLLLEAGTLAFISAWVGIILCFILKRNLPILGKEIVGNYFFPQLVATGFLFAFILILFRFKGTLYGKLVLFAAFLLILSATHSAVATVGYAFFIIVLFFELAREKGLQSSLWRTAIAAVAGAALFFGLPYNRVMIKIAVNNGDLAFSVFTKGPYDLKYIGVASLLLWAGYSILSLFRVWRKNYIVASACRVELFLSAVLLSSSAVALLQYGLTFREMGTLYSVKKFFFISFTSFVLLAALHIGGLLRRYLGNRVRLKNRKWVLLAVPVFILAVAHNVFRRTAFKTEDIVPYQKEIKGLFQSNADLRHRVIARLPVHNTLNTLLTIGDLKFSRNETSQAGLHGSNSCLDKEDYLVLTDNNYDGPGVVIRTPLVAIVPKNDYFKCFGPVAKN